MFAPASRKGVAVSLGKPRLRTLPGSGSELDTPKVCRAENREMPSHLTQQQIDAAKTMRAGAALYDEVGYTYPNLALIMSRRADEARALATLFEFSQPKETTP